MIAPFIAYSVYFLSLVGIFSYGMKTRGSEAYIAEMERSKVQASVSKVFAAKSARATYDASRVEPQFPGPSLGDPSAKVRIVEFVDYECPFSRKVDSVVQKYIQAHPHDVYLMLRDLPIVDLHPQAEDIAIAARCIWGQGDARRFWRYHTLLFANQGAQNVGGLRGFADDVGADLKRYDACVKAKTPGSDIERSLDDAMALGLDGTPSFFFNGVPVQGSMDVTTLDLLVKEAARNAN